MSAKISYHFIEATRDHAQQIVDTTNDAFIVDAFFKKPEYHLRFNYEEVLEMLKVENALFIVAVRDDDSSVIASIHLEIDIKEEDSITVIGHFSAVSVPSRYERQGIGKALVQAAEDKVLSTARRLRENTGKPVSVRMEMGVVNMRYVLFPWYKSQGYVELGEIHPNDPGFDQLLSEEYKEKVCLVSMRKDLTL